MGRNRGFSLLELLIALGILTVAFAALAQLSAATMKADRHNRHKTAALHLAQEKLEILKGIPFDELTSEWEGPLTLETFSVPFDRETTVNKDPQRRLAEVTVRVYWSYPSGGLSRFRVELSTRLAA
jgi:prepilin-type N-terminal cleavage/methylation domain-containing protein